MLEQLGLDGVRSRLGELGLVALLAVLAGLGLIRFAAASRPLTLLAILVCSLSVGALAVVNVVNMQEGYAATWGLWLVGAGGFGVTMTMGALLVANVRSGGAWNTERRSP